MASNPDFLDVAKFQLDAYKTAIDLRIKAMDVYGEYNVRLMEAAEKQMKIANDQFKLLILQQAYMSFRAAQQENLRRALGLQQKLERYTSALSRIKYLVMGETIPSTFIGLAWRGFWFLTSQAPVPAVIAMSGLKCSAQARKSSNFVDPTDPTRSIESAPGDIRAALALMDWARDKHLALRLDSPAMGHLVELLKILGDAAKELKSEAEKEWKQAREELAKLREMSWKALDLSNTPAKK